MKKDFLNDLVKSHTKVKPIGSLKIEFAKSFFVTVAYCAVVIYLMGFRDDLRDVVRGLFFNIEGLLLISASALGILVSLLSVRPGLLELRRFKNVPLILFVLIAVLVCSWIFKFSSVPNVQVFNFDYGRSRIIEVMMIIVVPLGWLIWTTRKGLLLRPGLTFASLSLTMGALSTLCLHLACCPFHPAQVFVWHFLPAMILAGMIVSVSRKFT